MRKIEQRMVNAINNKVNYKESNTEVIVKGANVFVRLYDTYIYAAQNQLELIYEQLCKYAESETDCILFTQVYIIANI